MDFVITSGAVPFMANREANKTRAANLAEAVAALEFVVAATALNGEVMLARKREATRVKEGDRIEIVAPWQGD